jgi:hypothetical protein
MSNERSNTPRGLHTIAAELSAEADIIDGDGRLDGTA